MDCKIVVTLLPLRASSVMLVRYRHPPDNQSGWFVPNDLLKTEENPEAAAKRILSDQLDLTSVPTPFSHFESFTGKDRSWHLVIHFKSELPSTAAKNPSAEIAAADWFKSTNLPPIAEIAHHGWAADIVHRVVA